MRGDPDKLNAEYAEQARLARDKHREPDGWEADAREEAKRDAMAEAESARMDAAVAEDDAERNARADSLKVDLLRIARMEFGISDEEARAFKAGLDIGRKDERNRILTALTAAEQETAALWLASSPVTVAVAAYTARVRRIVEGRT